VSESAPGRRDDPPGSGAATGATAGDGPLGGRRLLGTALLGLLAGMLSGLLGVGGGLIIVPGLVLMAHARQHVAHATSLAAIIPTAVAGVLAFGKASAVDWKVGALLAAGSLPGARGGALLMQRIPAHRLRTGFGVFVVAVGIYLLVTR
jgi:uncharacterized membrane protein YfcA